MTSPESDYVDVVRGKGIGYAPLEERGGAVTVEGSPGPVGAIAYLASTVLKGAVLDEAEEAKLLAQAAGLADDSGPGSPS